MSAPSFSWLPAALRPLEHEPPDRTGLRRAGELAVLLVVGALLTAATINDLVRQVGVDKRIAADRRTWNAYAHRSLHKVGVVTGNASSNDTACAPPFSGARVRLCLLLTGPTVGGMRTVAGGYKLPLESGNRFRVRFGCFGRPADEHLCGASGLP